MTVLLQVSDTHFGTELAPVMAALEQFTHELRPDVLLLSGDITQRATHRQFGAARAFVDRLRVPIVMAIPGNHDIPLFNVGARLFAPYGHYHRAFGRELEPEFENDAVLVLALNTTRWYRHAQGEVSAAQIERVARRLEQARSDQSRIVVVHQPVAVTLEQDRENLLHGNAAAVQRWAAAGVDLIVGGHIHLPFVLALHGRWPALARPVWAVQAGTAVSDRVRGGVDNSVNVIRVGAAARISDESDDTESRGCVVERWDHVATTRRFERAAAQRFSNHHGD